MSATGQAPVTSIAFLGLGHMGLPMASNLAAAGFTVRAYDPVPAAAAAARAAGLDVAGSPADAAAETDVVVTMLPTGRHVLDAYRPGGGIVGTVPEGALLIDSSTIDVADARAAHEIAARAGLRSLDAPVSGGTVGATAGTLTFMVGGDADAFEAAGPVLSGMGRRIVHCGGAGAGQAAKVCNNLILAESMIAVSEAFVLAESLGLSHQALYDVVSTSSGQCWAVTTNCPVPGPVPTSPANRGFDGGFATRLMAKDLRLAASAAAAARVDLPLGRKALDIYDKLEATAPDRDFSVVIDAIRERTPAQ
ncbi:MAG TPA: 3-hydroxyisobutyrate dehydrogenase [Acidimicrobiales bacterium]|nr:3-hydroxyisobutyrate dehydrogenase [Acidimicrobiales bacterium]